MEGKNGTTAIEPIRITPRRASKRIGIGYNQMLELIHRKVFTVFDNGKRGITRRIKLLSDEVELYAREGEEALKEHRAKKKRAKR